MLFRNLDDETSAAKSSKATKRKHSDEDVPRSSGLGRTSSKLDGTDSDDDDDEDDFDEDEDDFDGDFFEDDDDDEDEDSSLARD